MGLSSSVEKRSASARCTPSCRCMWTFGTEGAGCAEVVGGAGCAGGGGGVGRAGMTVRRAGTAADTEGGAGSAPAAEEGRVAEVAPWPSCKGRDEAGSVIASLNINNPANQGGCQHTERQQQEGCPAVWGERRKILALAQTALSHNRQKGGMGLTAAEKLTLAGDRG